MQAARKGAISLHLEASFKTLRFSTKALHNYTFPAGRADMFLFNDSYTSSIVEIKDGEAVICRGLTPMLILISSIKPAILI